MKKRARYPERRLSPEKIAIRRIDAIFSELSPNQQLKVRRAAEDLREVINRHGYAGGMALAVVSVEAWMAND